MTNSGSARGPKLGYLYQVRYALYILLTANEGARVAFEKLDDFQFESDDNATPKELLQFKHSIKSEATLTNKSPQLWKTIGNWSQLLLAGKVKPNTIPTLVTTANTPDEGDNITALLRPHIPRDTKSIVIRLLEISKGLGSTLAPHGEVFQSLSFEQREALVDAIQILDTSPDIWEASEKIKSVLQERPEHLEGIFERLEGWWLNRVILHLRQNDGIIARVELLSRLNDIREQFSSEALPIDFRHAKPPHEYFDNQEQLQFVQQLTCIGLAFPRIEWAIKDFYRAFAQRTKWLDEKLVDFVELQEYENTLREEWDRHRLAILEELDAPSTNLEEQKRVGRSLFNKLMEGDFDIPIRSKMSYTPYIMRGTYHILADEKPEPRVWWHPKFIERLRQILDVQIYKDLSEVSQLGTIGDLSAWEQRPLEVANMFNPAFCSVVLYEVMKGYSSEIGEGLPFALFFLVLPIILYKPIREALPRDTRTKLHPWIQRNPEMLPQFSELARQFVPITKGAVIFGMRQGIFNTNEARFTAAPYEKLAKYVIKGSVLLDQSEITLIRSRAGFVGRWFAQAGSVTSIFSWWGVTP